MKIIEKKTWPEFFRKVKDGKKNVEIRLADFKIKKDDILVLREWNPKKRSYTGWIVKRRVGAVHKVNMFKFHSLSELKKYGLYAIEF
ncbi:MAG: hypothetical protein A3G49_01635 [Candidatus Sungbacteria bacterium RIFCSPLOWO2_12_FULL_41_11]|uniref:DUF3850 domain-containing protein n=1 Tax=Candidatus Sungbacteria bacterium RIFCSPLOWO2_12_FULL_41_11 TaxID=1802286 RepID=A0A1G2LST4_9BACT|nr:MAG: hypothetical protein UV01_C0011G0045 [Parcubacteria group bacterium GW2011_GWA2_42_14]OGZ98398.1 MAG: hypothetical protein A3D41_01485 [Candidatus Sungbacteria bacterium RIFCSPHIGHO2_02_FULL_41_12b]OHA13922.1 MAG: hypothetical protein A3G49_01635 [Candidatus Sungbacteria bacterium RIFCSPLOWO2_12_FULL_41_11]